MAISHLVTHLITLLLCETAETVGLKLGPLDVAALDGRGRGVSYSNSWPPLYYLLYIYLTWKRVAGRREKYHIIVKEDILIEYNRFDSSASPNSNSET